MESEIIDALNDVGYMGALSNEVELMKAVETGPKSLEFTKLVHILAQELKELCQLEETINIMNDPDESNAFLLELSSFLKELGCPYKCLVTGYMSSRLQKKEDCLLLLDYLISELMAARMVNIEGDCIKKNLEIVVQESSTAKDLKDILIKLKFNKPPPNITPEMLFSKLEAKLKDVIAKEGPELVGKPLYNKALNEKEWKQLEIAYQEMYEDYSLRKETLITRLECTIQSFQWSERLKKDINKIQSAYRAKREKLIPKPDVKLSDFLAARTSVLQVEKTSSANVRKNTRSDVNKVIIGEVPDRGGRPNEQQPPPPEMPSWQQRTPGGGRGGSGGGRGGGGFGGRGGFNSDRGGQNSGRGGYDSGRNSIDSGRNSIDSGRGGYESARNDYDNGRNDHDGGRGGYNRGGRGGRGGRVQGGYSQGNDHGRPQTSPGNFNQNRNYQTYEVPPGGYNQDRGYSNDQNRSHYSSNNRPTAMTVSYGMGGNPGDIQPSFQSCTPQGTGYSNYRHRGNDGGYQNEHDDRDRRGRGGYYRGGRR